MRHGTAEKNLRKEHGGKGTSLTFGGRSEVKDVASEFQKNKIMISSIYSINKPQCIETSEIISDELNVNVNVISDIQTYNLGILDGLTEEEASNKYPSIAYRMELWRRGKIDISELNIPGSTDPVSFIKECKINLLPLLNDNLLIVGTRSILVAFSSILLNREPVKNGGYIEIPWKNSGYTIFYTNNGNSIINTKLSTNHIQT